MSKLRYCPTCTIKRIVKDTSFVKERNWKVSTYSKAVLKLQYPFYKMPQQRSANSYQVPNKSQSTSQPSICLIQTFAISSAAGVLQSHTKLVVNGKEIEINQTLNSTSNLASITDVSGSIHLSVVLALIDYL